MYYSDDKEDKKDLNNLYNEDYNDDSNEEDDNSEEDSSQDMGQIPNKGNFFKGMAGKAGKTIQKVSKVISMLPMPVKAALIVAITGVVFALIAQASKEEATAGVTSSTNSTVSNMETQVSELKKKREDGTITAEEQQKLEKLEKAIDQFNGKNSYLYFTIANINDAYDNFVSEYKGSTNDVQSRNYKSLSTDFGDDELVEDDKDSRIVNPNQKLPLYMHLLMTEKYNFNAVKWKWYGHGRDGIDMADSNMTLDKELGLKFPNDGTTKLETFVDLLSPYMLTWHIPLGFHSGFLTKSGSDKQASTFTYSILKNAYSDIIAHRYDIQKYSLDTKFNTYYEYKYRSKFKNNIKVTYEYRPQTVGKNEYKIDNSNKSNAPVIDTFDRKVIDGKGGTETKIAVPTGSEASDEDRRYVINNGYWVQYGNYNDIIRQIYDLYKDTSGEYDLIFVQNGGINQDQFSNLPVGKHKLKVMDFITVYSPNRKYNLIRAQIYEITVDVITSKEYKKDSNGNTLYNLYVKYEYEEPEIIDPELVSKSDLINSRINESTGEEDPMKEEAVNNSTSITHKYYVSEARTFDVIIANKFNYIKYSEEDVSKRINPKSQSQYALNDYLEEEQMENKLDINRIKNTYLTLNLESIDSNGHILCTSNGIKGNIKYYDNIKGVSPNEYIKITLSDDEIMKNMVTDLATKSMSMSSDNVYSYIEKYNNTYRSENDYIIKEGKSADGEGTHYIRRIWEDKLTQTSSKTTTYTEDDLIDFNAEYNSKLNGTNKSDEKSEYQKLVDKSEDSYSQYKGLAATKMLTTIDFVNSNSNIYSKYLTDNTPQSKIMGYNREYIKFALDEVKRLFKQTEDKNGTIPYVYGISLGFSNILTESSTRTLNSRANLFIWPLPDHEYVSYIFGYSSAYSGGTYNNPGQYGLHSGIDISLGDVEVLAAADGKVITCDKSFANEQKAENSYGNYVIIDHGNGYATLYAHMAQDVRVNIGDEVKKGQVIGISNTTGSSTGMHLHYEIRQDKNEDGAFTGDEIIDPLEFYLVEPANGNTIEYDELLLHPELGEQITMQDPYKFVGYAYDSSGGMSLSESTLSKEDFVAICQSNLSKYYNLTPDMEFYQKLEYTYKYCQEVGVNPEYAIVVAITENGKLNGYGVHNYWNVHVGNEQDPVKDGAHKDYEEALTEFCDLILSYRDEGSSTYNSIMKRAEEREAAGCNPEGYGGPDTLAGVKSVYSWLGDDHTGDTAGTGGMYYINIPGCIYETEEEIKEKCWNKHGTGPLPGGTSTHPTTIEEQNNYTVYRNKNDIGNKG